MRQLEFALVHPSAAARIDPAADAASLLRRIGFAVLCVALPVSAMVARRGAVVLMPVGAILLILAALLDPSEKTFGQKLQDLLTRPLVWLAIGLGVWSCLSLFWTPAPRLAFDRLANLAGVLVLAIGLVAAIPSRLRAPVLYLLPIGAFAAAALATLIILDVRFGRALFSFGADAITVQRGLATLVLMSVPAAGWLLSRGRILDALLLGVALMAVAVTGQDRVMALGVGVAVVAFAVTRVRPALGSVFVAASLLLLALVALIPLFMRQWQGETVAGMQMMPLFSGSFLRRLGRVITGYGIETTPRMASTSYFQPIGPTYFAGLWFDLGLVAVALIGAGFTGAWRRAQQVSPHVQAAVLALILVISVQGTMLAGTYQAWWLSSLIAAIAGVAAIAKGQGRSRRPRMQLFARMDAGPAA